MKKEFYFSFFLQSAIFFTSIFNLLTTRSWMFKSGLFLLTNTPIQLLSFSIFATLFSILMMFFFSRRYRKAYPVITFILSIPCISLEFTFSHTLIFNIEKFFGLQMSKWSDNYQTWEIQELERRFKCCGYYVYNEYPSSFCPNSAAPGEPKPPACMSVLISSFQQPLYGFSVFFMSVGLARLISVISFYLAYDESKDPSATSENRPFLLS